MILRAQPVGKEPALRWVIQDVDKDKFWNGERFINSHLYAVKYAHPSDACGDMQVILKKKYKNLNRHRYLVPVEIEVYGDRSKETIARYLHQATVLSMRTDDYGNGPGECLVLPTIHWGLIREVGESAFSPDVDNPVVAWGLEKEDEN